LSGISHLNAAGWNNENWLNQARSGSLSSHWHMPSNFMNYLASNGEYRANCFQSKNNYERLWTGVRAYTWTQVTSATSSTSLDGATSYATAWNPSHMWGLTSGNNERDTVITSHSSNEWACAGNQGPGGEGAAMSLFAQLTQSFKFSCHTQVLQGEVASATCVFVSFILLC
jgi:hypothetical protein